LTHHRQTNEIWILTFKGQTKVKETMREKEMNKLIKKKEENVSVINKWRADERGKVPLKIN